MSEELATPLRRWLLSSRTRRQVAKALGGGDHPNDTYLRMATSICQFLWSDAVNQPHTDPTWAGRSSDPEPAPRRPTAHTFEQVNWADAESETRIGVLQEMVAILLNRLDEAGADPALQATGEPPCHECDGAIVGLHYHRETADGSEVVRRAGATGEGETPARLGSQEGSATDG